MKQELLPTLDDLRAEFVLMQAWKKTSTYLRQHSWYADTLEIDFQSLRIPAFLREIQERLKSPQDWTPSLLEFVPAPKSQSWRLSGDKWKPKPTDNIRNKIRPLAHLGLQDQVVATAILMCVANRVEQTLGDPLEPIEEAANRRKVLAYGHRLFCESSSGVLRNRWGSSKLYRLYFSDYQTFLRRPELVSQQLKADEKALKAERREIAIVQSDLSKFYDRVRPSLLHEKINALFHGPGEADFVAFFRKVFDWRWLDAKRARQYAELHGINGFESIALPQGLVASGFFANIALHDFDTALRQAFDKPIDPDGHFILKDVCYYVDDLRLVLLVKQGTPEFTIEATVQAWLQDLLNQHAPGLVVEQSKTKATVADRQKRFLVPQSKAAKRIQNEVSGVFDMLHGTELIGAIEGFFHTQQRYSSNSEREPARRSGLLIGISDMRDDTAARFAAGRFRRTFRSLRPLLQSENPSSPVATEPLNEAVEETEPAPRRLVLSQEQLDERGQLFAAMLIDEWVANPGNVRLLRIALDLYPDAQYLDRVLSLLRPGWAIEQGTRGPAREVQQYCLAELFRAGATETGLVADDDCLPSGIDVDEYHRRLSTEATDILNSSMNVSGARSRFPWFLLQQVVLYLIARNQISRRLVTGPRGKSRGLYLHQRFARFLEGVIRVPLEERAAFLTLARSSFGLDEAFNRALAGKVSSKFLRCIGEISPEAAQIAWNKLKATATPGQSQTARALGLESSQTGAETVVADFVLRERNPFWQEENLLRLAAELLAVSPDNWPEVLTPWQIACEVSASNGSEFGRLKPGSVKLTQALPKAAHLFMVPEWCDTPEDKRRFQLGLILRFALRGSVDLFSVERQIRSARRPRYSPPVSHWQRQRYSTFQGRAAFGPPWIPISSWTEDFMFDLLRWPGSGLATPIIPLVEWASRLSARLSSLQKSLGKATTLPFLEQAAPWPDSLPKVWTRPLRVGIVQSVIPNMDDYTARPTDPELVADALFRLRQRRHLAALLEAVVQTLEVRETHRDQHRQDGRILDLLVFPELAIHPLDVQPLILPFIRTYKCIVLFGQVYHPAGPRLGSPLINSCVWAIPEWRAATGFSVRFVEQGKEHLTQEETGFTPRPVGFRPAQWIVEYRWDSNPAVAPLRLSASVCYDATDLALAADLKSKSDLYVVCALNRDVGTFDRMSEGLHYHMYQGMIVVNNGQYGGSSFYMPFSQSYHRQVLHLHGQPQATIAFAEITPKKLIGRPNNSQAGDPVGVWKTPPANPA
jgi:hypothetical protein